MSKSNFTITQSQTGNFETELGKTVMESFLKKTKAGCTKIDAVKLAFQAIIDDEMNVTVECSPPLGPQFVQAIKDLEAGKTLAKVTWSIEGVYEQKDASAPIDSRVY